MRLLIIDDHESFLQAVAAMLRHIAHIEVTRRLKAGPNPPKVVMMSVQTDPEYQAQALGAGADAFIPKTELHTGLAPLLTRMGHGPG